MPNTPRLGYVIVHVPDVASTVAFWERAFGLETRMVHDAGDYAELETGTTTLAFVGESFAASQLDAPPRPNRPDVPPAAIEVCLVMDDVESAYRRAVGAGATPTTEPAATPWGQTIAYVRDEDGILVELASPM